MRATVSDDTRSGPGEWIVRHSYNVRVCHWVNLIASGYLLVSGVHIFLDFPELYWGHTGYQGYPAIFKLSDWGMSWDRAGELGDRMWGRNYHITFAWVFLLNGVVYVGWNLATGYFRDQMSLARVELTPRRLWADLRRHLPWPGSTRVATSRDGTLQKVSYLLLIFVFVPLMILTGIAQSPGITAAAPVLLDIFGGRQSARSLHTVGTLVLVLFVVVHVFEVVATGAFNRIRSMITGKYAISNREEES